MHVRLCCCLKVSHTWVESEARLPDLRWREEEEESTFHAAFTFRSWSSVVCCRYTHPTISIPMLTVYCLNVHLKLLLYSYVLNFSKLICIGFFFSIIIVIFFNQLGLLYLCQLLSYRRVGQWECVAMLLLKTSAMLLRGGGGGAFSKCFITWRWPPGGAPGTRRTRPPHCVWAAHLAEFSQGSPPAQRRWVMLLWGRPLF